MASLLFPSKKIAWLSGLIFLIIYLLFKLIVAFSPPEKSIFYSKEILDEKGRLLAAFLSEDEKWRLFSPDHEIPPRLLEWLIWKEDKYYYYHPGINPVSIFGSALENIWFGKRKSGASTITMQAVKLAHPAKRTWTSKIKEAFLAIYWEMAFSKSDILEFYLGHLPFGGNVEGFRSASRIYFRKNLNQLSLAQWATLVVVPNHPGRNNPIQNPENLKIMRNQFLTRLWKGGKISDAEFKSARLEPVFAKRYAMPNAIPHLSRKLQTQDGIVIITTLNLDLQKKVEDLLAMAHSKLKRMGIQNASLLVAEKETGEIKAWIGNPDFADAAHAGQVDGVLAIRSPGSTLKPFLYTLGFQKGLICPKTILYDLPNAYQDFTPENYDEQFRGPVSAEEALLQSLNIPAIGLLEKIGVDTLLKYLDQLKMNQLRKVTREPGLSLAVGGCGTNLFELVQAYRVLACEGKAGNLHFVKTKKQETNEKQIFEPGAVQITNQILSLNNRSQLVFSLASRSGGLEKFSWKTGTSFRRKDAWCIGFGPKFVLGIWLGNFSGEGLAGLSGVETAAPVFQQILGELEKNSEIKNEKIKSISNWRTRKVCRETGLKPGLYCDHLISDLHLPLVSSQEICQHKKAFLVNQKETESYCESCRPATGVKSKMYENPEPAWAMYYLQKGKKFLLSPPHHAACPVFGQEESIVFQFPMDGKVYFLENEETMPLAVKLTAPQSLFPIRLYQNGKMAGSSLKGEEIKIALPIGQHQLTALATNGSNQKIRFWIRNF